MEITNKLEIEQYIKYYYKHIGDNYLLQALINYSELKGFGIEDIWCCFANEYEEWEEDYFGESGVAYYFDYPAVENDCIIILNYQNFFRYLFDACQEYINRYPENEKNIYKYLDIIKNNLGL